MATLDYDSDARRTGVMDWDARRFFVLGVRIFFGLWLLYVGLMKWIMIGPRTFVGFITGPFDKTWSPHALNVALAWVILIYEPVLAALILLGLRPRIVWTLTALLMFMLTIGQTILGNQTVIEQNWHYLVLTLVCAALSEPVSGRAVGVRRLA